MASSLATTTASASAASVTGTAPNAHSYLPICHRSHSHSHSRVSFRLSHKPRLQIFTKGLQSSWNRSTIVKAQLKKVSVDGSSNAAAAPTKSDIPASETKDAKPSSDSSPAALASEESMSEFIDQVANLVKLVDSRDIVELQLKQLDCELLIRKTEALPQPSPSAPAFVMHSPPPPAFQAAPPAAVPAPSAPAPSSAPAPAPAPAPSAPGAKSSLTALKCPMAGTFYRSAAPGEPPLVKVGDKVQKGQVLCIIEAMKLMNEIEADQSGTILEILVENGKPVSVDIPLFVIEP